jgi:hypothetical protein
MQQRGNKMGQEQGFYGQAAGFFGYFGFNRGDTQNGIAFGGGLQTSIGIAGYTSGGWVVTLEPGWTGAIPFLEFDSTGNIGLGFATPSGVPAPSFGVFRGQVHDDITFTMGTGLTDLFEFGVYSTVPGTGLPLSLSTTHPMTWNVGSVVDWASPGWGVIDWDVDTYAAVMGAQSWSTGGSFFDAYERAGGNRYSDEAYAAYERMVADHQAASNSGGGLFGAIAATQAAPSRVAHV